MCHDEEGRPQVQERQIERLEARSDDEIHYSDKAAAAAKIAKDLLQRVVTEHPGTPWALLAQRELKDPFGFRWVETYVKPVEKMNAADAANKKKKEPPKPMSKPEQPPKL